MGEEKKGLDNPNSNEEPNGNLQDWDVYSMLNEENQWILKKYDWDMNKVIDAYKESNKFYSSDKPRMEEELEKLKNDSKAKNKLLATKDKSYLFDLADENFAEADTLSKEIYWEDLGDLIDWYEWDDIDVSNRKEVITQKKIELDEDALFKKFEQKIKFREQASQAKKIMDNFYKNNWIEEWGNDDKEITKIFKKYINDNNDLSEVSDVLEYAYFKHKKEPPKKVINSMIDSELNIASTSQWRWWLNIDTISKEDKEIKDILSDFWSQARYFT